MTCIGVTFYTIDNAIVTILVLYAGEVLILTPVPLIMLVILAKSGFNFISRGISQNVLLYNCVQPYCSDLQACRIAILATFSRRAEEPK